MRELWLIAVIAILGIVITFASSSKDFFYKNIKGQFRIKRKGYIVLICGLGIVGLSVWQAIILDKPLREPIIIIRQDGISFEKNTTTTQFAITLVSTEAPSILPWVDYMSEVHYKDGSVRVTNLYRHDVEKTLPTDERFVMYTNLNTIDEIEDITYAFKGKYYSVNQKEFDLEIVCRYDIGTGLTLYLMPDLKQEFLKKYNLN